ncbi:MAG: hypothetical protein WD907_01810 [Bacilli bacterium]
MKADLTHADNHRRSIASQILCNLAKSDPENRMLNDFAEVMAVTKDKMFVTARHCLQSLWNVSLGATESKEMVVKGLADRFIECSSEKNYHVIHS